MGRFDKREKPTVRTEEKSTALGTIFKSVLARDRSIANHAEHWPVPYFPPYFPLFSSPIFRPIFLYVSALPPDGFPSLFIPIPAICHDILMDRTAIVSNNAAVIRSPWKRWGA